MWTSTLFCWLSLGLEATALFSPHSPNSNVIERAVAADAVCVPGPNGVATQPQVIVYPVTVQTSCPANTVISVGGCPNGITVTNAPTFINTCVTATSTVTVTSTQTSNAPSPVPTGLSADAQEIVRELNLLTALTRNAAAQSANLNDATVEQIADSLDAITRQLEAFTPIVQGLSPITAQNDLAAITAAFNNFVEAQAALLSTLDQQSGGAGSANSTTPAVQKLRRATRLSPQSSDRLANALQSLKTALDAYVTALSLLLQSLAEAFLAELALLDALYQALIDKLRGNGGATPSVTGTSPTSSIPSTLPTITFPSNTSSPITSTQGTGSTGPATVLPTGTGVTTLPVSLNGTTTATSGLGSGTSAPTMT